MTLKGGPVEPREVVDAYINANRALFNVKKDLKLDMDAARTLNVSESGFNSATDRISNIEKNAIDNNVFRPISISLDVRNAFAENAAKIGEADPFQEAASTINQIQQELADISLEETELPFIENPLLPAVSENTVTGPNTLNLPSVDQQTMAASGQINSLEGLSTAQKLSILFGRT